MFAIIKFLSHDHIWLQGVRKAKPSFEGRLVKLYDDTIWLSQTHLKAPQARISAKFS